MSSTALCSRSSNGFDRWLISITDMPDAGERDQIALRLLEHRKGKNRGAGGKVEDAGRCGRHW